jgi:hypothetical protein
MKHTVSCGVLHVAPSRSVDEQLQSRQLQPLLVPAVLHVSAQRLAGLLDSSLPERCAGDFRSKCRVAVRHVTP